MGLNIFGIKREISFEFESLNSGSIQFDFAINKCIQKDKDLGKHYKTTKDPYIQILERERQRHRRRREERENLPGAVSLQIRLKRGKCY